MCVRVCRSVCVCVLACVVALVSECVSLEKIKCHFSMFFFVFFCRA